ncbi:hypothetical protein A2U01_0024971, partial [Trifolium medium]|nr:hypothetical protein [Trifolium medium]
MESVMKCPGEAANSNIEEGSSSALSYLLYVNGLLVIELFYDHWTSELIDIFIDNYIDDSDDESDGIESAEDNDEEDTFMRP